MKNQQNWKKRKQLHSHIKTEKELYRDTHLIRQQQSKIRFNFITRHIHKQRQNKLRHTSMLSNEEENQPKEKYNTEELARKKVDKKQIERKLPQIYHVQPNSMKMINIDKFKKSNKVTSTSAVQKGKKIESYSSDTKIIEEKKKGLKTRLNQLQSLKELNREEKNKIFKVIRMEFQNLINTSNNLSIKNPQYNFRAYVQKGNNGILVRELLKKRWWWHIEERDVNRANLIWTEWFNKSVTDGMENIEGRDQTLFFEEYKVRQSEHIKTEKQSSVSKIVGDNTFTKIKGKISFNSNNYFVQSKKGLSESLWELTREQELKNIKTQANQVIHNHVDGCLHLHSKKLLYKNFYSFMKKKQWDPFEFMPVTFYIDRSDSPHLDDFLSFYEKENQNENNKNIWICKPGQNSNRGYGIKVMQEKEQIVEEIRARLSENTQWYEKRTVILQKYLEKCFLIKNRKFDIRCFILLTTANGILKGYWYRDGYIRTSSEEYNLQNLDNVMIHLTNDAVQRKGTFFGKYEDYNKMNFQSFKQYLEKTGISRFRFDDTYEQMKLISYYMIVAVSSKIKRKQFTFELFGLDFMLDDNLKPYLIEANSNPCLENYGKIMGSLMHNLVENVIMTAIDPIFPPPANIKKPTQFITKDYFESNQFELIFTGK